MAHMSRAKRKTACVLSALAIVCGLLLALPGQAMAMTNTVVGSKWQIPMGGVYLDNMRIDNCSISCGGDAWWEDATDVSTSGGYPGARVRLLKVSGAGWHSDSFTLRWSNGGQTVHGERVDVIMTLRGITVGVEDGSTSVSVGGLYDMVDGDFFSYMASQDSGGKAYCGTQGKGHCWVIGDYDWNIVYRGTNTTVSEPFVYIVDDLDFTWNGHAEGVWLGTGFDGTTWIRSGCALGIDGNHYYNVGGGSDGGNDFNFNSGVAGRTYNGKFTVGWEGRGCSTYVSTSVTSYPSQAVGTPVKTNSTDGDKAPAGLDEDITYTISQFVPYAPASFPTSRVMLQDTLDPCLDAAGARVSVTKKADEQTGWKDVDVTSQFAVSVSGQTVTVSARSPRNVAGTIEVSVTATVIHEADFDGYSTGTWPEGGSYWTFPNTAQTWCHNVSKTTPESWAKTWYGSVDLVVESANDPVSQLGSNDCYSLVGHYVLWKDEERTEMLYEGDTDEEGRLFFDRVNPGTYWLTCTEPGAGFAHNTEISIPVVLGRETTYVERSDVPQSEDMQGKSLASKKDLELWSEGLRHNPLWHEHRDGAASQV